MHSPEHPPTSSGTPPRYAPPRYAAPQPSLHPIGGRINVLGIVALALLTANALQGLVVPMLYQRMAYTGDFTLVNGLVSTLNVVVLLTATALAALGLRSAEATRFRWAAVGALVAAVLSLLGTLASMLGAFTMTMLLRY